MSDALGILFGCAVGGVIAFGIGAFVAWLRGR